MSLPFRCTNGHVFINRSIFGGNGYANYFEGNKVLCHCGAIATNITGTYWHKDSQVTAVSGVSPADQSIIDAVLRAFSAPEVTRQKVEAFKSVAEAAKAGEITAEDAAKAVNDIAPSLGDLWRWINENGSGIGAISSVLALVFVIIQTWLAIEAGSSSDRASDQAHLDAMQNRQEIHGQAMAEHEQTEVEKKILEILMKQPLLDSVRAQPPQTKLQVKPRSSILHTSKNRHERRKATATAKAPKKR